MRLTDELPPLHVSTPLKVNQRITSVKSPVKNNNPTTNMITSSDVVMKDTSIEENILLNGGLEDYLSKLRQEKEIMMTNYDTKIEDFRSKIDKATQQLKKLTSGLKKLVAEKQNKQKEFLKFKYVE